MLDTSTVTWRWYPGDEAQPADPFIAAKMGAANTPAYRGTADVVFEDLVYLCETKGFATGIDLTALAAVRDIPEHAMPGEKFYGGIARAGPPAAFDWRA